MQNQKIRLRVASYNISHGQDHTISIDDAPVDLPKTAGLIKEIDADIIALNEVYFRGVEESCNNQTEELQKSTGYPYAVDAVGKDLSWAVIGNALLSKYPIVSHEDVPVYAPTEEERREGENEWYEDRVVISALVNVNGVEIRALATHFGLNPLEQERMVETLCRLIDGENRPILLLGDFNARPHAKVLQPIYERLDSAAERVGNTEYTFASYAPDRTIDYVFVSKSIEVEEFLVRKEIVSDHRAIQATVSI